MYEQRQFSPLVVVILYGRALPQQTLFIVVVIPPPPGPPESGEAGYG
jgi:hypothetical protein